MFDTFGKLWGLVLVTSHVSKELQPFYEYLYN